METEAAARTAVKEGEGALDSFTYATKSAGTKRQYLIRLQYFFNYLKLPGATEEECAASFLKKAVTDKQYAHDCIIGFINHHKEKIENDDLEAGTLLNYYHTVKLFYIMNDVDLNWDKIARGLPTARYAANDRAPTLDESGNL